MSLDVLARTAYNEDHEAFRQTVRQFLLKEVAPNAAKWDDDGIVPKSLWPKAGELGLLCMSIPEEYGGMGASFAHEVVVMEEQAFRSSRISLRTISFPMGRKNRRSSGCPSSSQVRQSPP